LAGQRNVLAEDATAMWRLLQGAHGRAAFATAERHPDGAESAADATMTHTHDVPSADLNNARRDRAAVRLDSFTVQSPLLMADDPDKTGGDEGTEGETGVVTRTRPKTKKPSLYRVLILNDDYTPMEFVVHVLEKYFNKGREDATRIMLHVHQKGSGVCGVYTYEVAETKVTQVIDFARQHGHPLQCIMEKE
jgi:ATP-dependent Clp protease adaptor protein ClpS